MKCLGIKKLNSKSLFKIKLLIKKYPKFYQKVWLTVMKIPKGEVRSYKWVAKKIGVPDSYRSVGNALNKNPFSPIIPCHRVIKTDNTLGGFSCGLKQKIFLLKKEGVKIIKTGNKIKVEI